MPDDGGGEEGEQAGDEEAKQKKAPIGMPLVPILIITRDNM